MFSKGNSDCIARNTSSETSRWPNRSNAEGRRTRRRTRLTTPWGPGTVAPREKKANNTANTSNDSPRGKLEGNAISQQNSPTSKQETDTKTLTPPADHPTATNYKHRYPIAKDNEYNKWNQHIKLPSGHRTPSQNVKPLHAVYKPDKRRDSKRNNKVLGGSPTRGHSNRSTTINGRPT